MPPGSASTDVNVGPAKLPRPVSSMVKVAVPATSVDEPSLLRAIAL
ncbi:MAG: hypothetical protein IPJ34_17785 [Myxococcales bacterium]|nr:hypothetical protein [Myxococcales bacterium]